jgi:hypothetical protein
MIFLVSIFILLLPVAANVQEQRASSELTRVEKEQFLLTAGIVVGRRCCPERAGAEKKVNRSAGSGELEQTNAGRAGL